MLNRGTCQHRDFRISHCKSCASCDRWPTWTRYRESDFHFATDVSSPPFSCLLTLVACGLAEFFFVKRSKIFLFIPVPCWCACRRTESDYHGDVRFFSVNVHSVSFQKMLTRVECWRYLKVLTRSMLLPKHSESLVAWKKKVEKLWMVSPEVFNVLPAFQVLLGQTVNRWDQLSRGFADLPLEPQINELHCAWKAASSRKLSHRCAMVTGPPHQEFCTRSWFPMCGTFKDIQSQHIRPLTIACWHADMLHFQWQRAFFSSQRWPEQALCFSGTHGNALRNFLQFPCSNETQAMPPTVKGVGSAV